MLNFQELQPIVPEKYSFVGIQKNNDKLQLYLPKGFNAETFNTYDSKRDIYFMLYKILQRYKQICIEKGNLENQLVKDRDGVIQSNDSVQKVVIPQSDNDEILLYSKLDVVGKILDAYDEPKIMSLAYRLGESEEVDYSQIHQYLDRAKYLPNGAAYIDTMDMPRLQVEHQSTDIVGMYCYILSEVKQQLGEDITSEIQLLAEGFANRYLSAKSGLFKEEYCIETVEIIKDILEIIEHKTPIKDADYWDFHNAIELFVYGELSQQSEGEIWGTKNFYDVWESMCLTYLAKSIHPSRLLYIDSNNLSSDVITRIENEPKLLNVNNSLKNLRPDAVILDNLYNIQQVEITSNYHLRRLSWNDYHYETAFRCTNAYFHKKPLKIVYANQQKKNHTFYELQKLYITPANQHGYLTINDRLSDVFYSFWIIDAETLNHEVLSLMYTFNHVFYVAIEYGIYTKEKFDIFCNNLEGDVFKVSLFRDAYSFNYNLIQLFENFVKAITYLNIIDIKYKPIYDYSDRNKCEEIKSRDIDKQFKYENLLQQHIYTEDKFNKLNIKSSFWLPTDDDSQHMSKVEPEYLNGYIELNKVSFNIVAKNYLE
ncbi:hypothetical protein NIES267_58170 [Calothrix parasitica NIES-267]|uniref:Uncharacterized protein n=1 Tax=Calothrix parasitica NIES-267 TaxID=1973488 RepID=A0A1Z4LYT1_9CYAN|nr:hypothetical protein NIES267_58170 [Calothrix parasitica NIES-267]